ncbi:MAG: glutaredoxin domain-containing protein [Aquihabitans sp.]
MNPADPILQVYWRPGCSACTSLRLALVDAGITASWLNIHQDPAAATWVRSVAGGNETVPTIAYGDRVIVAPRPDRIVEDLRLANPDLPIRPYRAWPPLRILQWVTIIALLVTSEALNLAGHSTLSWGADGAALLAFAAIRRVRLHDSRET